MSDSDSPSRKPPARKIARLGESSNKEEQRYGPLPAQPCGKTFLTTPNLSDRQRMRWALRTEAEVRLAKLRSREPRTSYASTSIRTESNHVGSLSEVDARDDTMNSDKLIDLYPSTGAPGKPFLPTPSFNKLSKKEQANMRIFLRDKEKFHRKLSPFFAKLRTADSSISTLVKLNIELRPSPKVANVLATSVAPPNLLIFEIILEGFMGYRVPSFHGSDPMLPRAAVMGGAVLAALAAWHYEEVRTIFKNLQSDEFLSPAKSYWSRRIELVEEMNYYFQPNPGLESHALESPYCTGDVDVFLQQSPLKHKVFKFLSDNGIEGDVAHLIRSFCDPLSSELSEFSRRLCGEYLEPAMSEIGLKLVYAMSTNALSFSCTFSGDQDYNEWKHDYNDGPKSIWPRVSQLIMLDDRADLVGALFDFDISAAAFSFDGNHVRAAPRAAFSLMTRTQVVTPNILNEKRNRTRIVKYAKRGFSAYMLDPYCDHTIQCDHGLGVTFPRYETDVPEPSRWTNSPTVVKWKSQQFKTETDYGRYILDLGLIDEKERVLTCCSIGKDNYFEAGSIYSQQNKNIALFEVAEGHAIDFLSKRNGWSAHEMKEVASYSPSHRYACNNCRYDYALWLVFSRDSQADLLDPDDLQAITSFQQGESEQVAEKPKSQLAALHEQAQAMMDVKKEAIDRATRAEKKVEDVMLQLECPICFETKDESTALGCGHVMCSDCVKEHASEVCPTCRKSVESRTILYK